MLEFRDAKLEDVYFFKEVFSKLDRMGSEACFGNLYMWGKHYDCKIAVSNDIIYLKAGDSFTVPAGKNKEKILEGINCLYEYASENNMPLCFHCVDENQKELLEEAFPNKFVYEETRDVSDYIYRVSDLAELKGKKYHSKRNHISFFENNFNWTYEPMTLENVPECLEFAKYWYLSNKDKAETGTDKEMEAIEKALGAFSEIGFVGGILRVEGEVVAFTFGEAINDSVFCTHVEKASADIRGAYPMINREFARKTINSFEFVNREEDLGLPGLRKAKESYKPEFLLEKVNARMV
ncbi:MAG: phosphatidylglycerol lysyltransferase domain-containing protein [Oscillospiraceae bacterium]|nr:phosphatidylglycerol lysyltransferase domain-containing protein [Oscillospiraceae bacterium]